MTDDVEPWEVHSELVLVSPEVYRRALAELPERNPDASPARPPAVDAPAHGREPHTSLPVAVLWYTLWRLGHTAEFGLIVLGAILALILLAGLLR